MTTPAQPSTSSDVDNNVDIYTIDEETQKRAIDTINKCRHGVSISFDANDNQEEEDQPRDLAVVPRPSFRRIAPIVINDEDEDAITSLKHLKTTKFEQTARPLDSALSTRKVIACHESSYSTRLRAMAALAETRRRRGQKPLVPKFHDDNDAKQTSNTSNSGGCNVHRFHTPAPLRPYGKVNSAQLARSLRTSTESFLYDYSLIFDSDFKKSFDRLNVQCAKDVKDFLKFHGESIRILLLRMREHRLSFHWYQCPTEVLNEYDEALAYIADCLDERGRQTSVIARALKIAMIKLHSASSKVKNCIHKTNGRLVSK
jgi:hypothetical protein